MSSKEEAAAATSNKRPRSSDNDNDDGNNDGGDNGPQQQPQPAPITADGEMPKKKFYRSRAHCNPLSHNDAFDYPVKPSDFDWTVDHYPHHPSLLALKQQQQQQQPKSGVESESEPAAAKKLVAPDVLDIGCGFGGLTVALSTLLPQSTILGLEIRSKVTEYVRLRIAASRHENAEKGLYQNCSVMRSNTMKYMPNLFAPASLTKIFFCFPDPHFKRKNHPRRIVSERLLTEYAYFLKTGGEGRLYTITDVEELHLWHVAKCRAHPLFRELSEEEMKADECVEAMKLETEEGKKVERAGAAKYYAVYERIGSVQQQHDAVSSENFWDLGEFGVAPLQEAKDE